MLLDWAESACFSENFPMVCLMIMSFNDFLAEEILPLYAIVKSEGLSTIGSFKVVRF